MNIFFTKRLLQAFFILLAFGKCSFSQTLFTYGKNKVDVADFMRTFKASNEYKMGSSYATSLKNYLPLYINTTLKTHQAYELKYDTLQSIQNDLELLRKQISVPYYTDSTMIKRLLQEAVYRSKHDVHLAHIFIARAGTLLDSATVQKNIQAVKDGIKNGIDFATLARTYSNDPSAQVNGGDLNYITSFSLPYAFENIAYTTPVGTVAPMYTSPKGYHFFKVLDVRDNPGKIVVYQILLANPPGSSEQEKKSLKKRADSIYIVLKNGADFSELVSKYSVDYVSANNRGMLQPISIGEYEKTFEEKAWSLKKEGELTEPFETAHGIHILKRSGLTLFDEQDPQQMTNLITRLKKDARWDLTYDFIYNFFEKKKLLQKQPFDDRVLWQLSDSLVYGRLAKIGDTLTPLSALFKINDVEYTVEDWVRFVRSDRFSKNLYGIQYYPAELENYEKNIMQRYYNQHMEQVNDSFAMQYETLKNNIIFFEIQKNMVWDKSQENPLVIEQFYNAHKQQYTWGKSADVVLFTTDQQSMAQELLQKIKIAPATWETITQGYNPIFFETTRLNWADIPGLGSRTPVADDVLPVTKADNGSFTFALIRNVYNEPHAMSLEEARPRVINDYQDVLEKQWMAGLRKKYPVVINQQVVNRLLAGHK